MNVATCRVTSFGAIIFNLVVLLRLVYGPLPKVGVMAVHFLFITTSVSFLTMLTFKMVLKAFFVLNFNKMIHISECKIMGCMWAVTLTCTFAFVIQEVTIREVHGLDYYSRRCFNIFLGKVGNATIHQIIQVL